METFPKLRAEYPFMFSKRYHDNIWIGQINDTLQQQLFKEVHLKFGNTELLEDKLSSMFQHLKYYYKEFKTPRVIAVTSYVDYRNKVIITDSIALMALDTYLGEEHEFYIDIHKYISKNLKPEMITSDFSEAYAINKIPNQKRKTLLDEMIYHGKILYFKDRIIPDESDAIKIGYSEDELFWAIENEIHIWSYFIDRSLLFDTDNSLATRFINPAPFSKFNLELDSESPGRLGQYIGWQIVRAYMDNNKSTLLDMLNTSAEDIFNNSKFKPRK